jgi:hypothetical protein
MTKDRSSPEREAQRTTIGGFLPKGSLSEDAEKEQKLGFRTDSSGDDSYAAIRKGRASYDVAGSEPTVGLLGVPVRNLPPSMMVGRPKDQNIRAELSASPKMHELP